MNHIKESSQTGCLGNSLKDGRQKQTFQSPADIELCYLLGFVTSKNLWTNAKRWHHLCASWHGKLICVQFKWFTMFVCWCNIAIGGPDNNHFRFPWKNPTSFETIYQSYCCAYHWWKKVCNWWVALVWKLSQEISFRRPRTSDKIAPKTLSLFLVTLSPEGYSSLLANVNSLVRIAPIFHK